MTKDDFQEFLADQGRLTAVLHTIAKIYNKGEQVEAAISMMCVLNKLAPMKQVKLLGMNLGVMTTVSQLEADEMAPVSPGFLVWLGLGPINRDTNFFNTVVVLNLRSVIPLDCVPIIFTNIQASPRSLAHIKELLNMAQNAYETEMLKAGDDTPDDGSIHLDLREEIHNDDSFAAMMNKLMAEKN